MESNGINTKDNSNNVDSELNNGKAPKTVNAKSKPADTTLTISMPDLAYTVENRSGKTNINSAYKPSSKDQCQGQHNPQPLPSFDQLQQDSGLNIDRFDVSPTTPVAFTPELAEQMQRDSSNSTMPSALMSSSYPDENATKQLSLSVTEGSSGNGASFASTIADATNSAIPSETSVGPEFQSLALSDDDHKTDISGMDTTAKRKNAEFHILFPNMLLSEILIQDYGCALQKGTLLQGRMYLTNSFICFYSNLFGWVNQFVIPFSEVVAFEKKNTAYVIPNAIQVNTLQYKYLFASLLSRDAAYTQLMELWKPFRTSTKYLEAIKESAIQAANAKKASNNKPDQTRDTTNESETRGITNGGNGDLTTNKAKDIITKRASTNIGPSECECMNTGDHLKNVALDATFDIDIDVLNRLLLEESGAWMSSFLKEHENINIQFEPWNQNTRRISYVKSLNNPMGPKSTRCIITETKKHDKLPSSLTFESSTETPDVPSGANFRSMFRVCIMNQGEQKTRMIATFEIVWLKSSWLKGPIEKGVHEGTTTHFSNLEKAIRNFISNPTASKVSNEANKPSSSEKTKTDVTEPKPNIQNVAVEPEVPKSFWTRILMSPTQYLPTFELYQLFLCLLLLLMITINVISWKKASELERQLKYFNRNPERVSGTNGPAKPKNQANIDSSLKPAIKEVMDDIMFVTQKVRGTIQTLDSQVEKLFNVYTGKSRSSNESKDNTPHDEKQKLNHADTDFAEKAPEARQKQASTKSNS